MTTIQRMTFVVLVLALASAECAKVPPEAPMITKLAYTGVQTAEWIGAAQEVIGAIGRTSPNQAVKEQSIKLLEALQQGNQIGLSLIPVLRLIDQAQTPPPSELAKAAGMVADLQRIVEGVRVQVEPAQDFKESTPALLRSLTEIRTLQMGVASLQEKAVQQ
jgi:hypothetical protein